MKCTCGHPPWGHITTTYPTHSRPCNRCLTCGGKINPRGCCYQPKKCHCDDFQRAIEAAS